jgi:hypothetical protein
MLHNVLVRQLSLPPETIERALAAASIAPDRRPQTLAVGEWLALAEALGDLGPDRRGTGQERRRGPRGRTPEADPDPDPE